MSQKEVKCPHCGKPLPNDLWKELKENALTAAKRQKIEGVKCKICGGTRLCRDGKRWGAEGEEFQRYLCYECGYRFSVRQA